MGHIGAKTTSFREEALLILEGVPLGFELLEMWVTSPPSCNVLHTQFYFCTYLSFFSNKVKDILLDEGICGRHKCWALGQGGMGHAQDPLLGTVPTNEATGMDKDAAWNTTDPALDLTQETPPRLWQGSLLWNEWRAPWAHAVPVPVLPGQCG